MDGAVWIIETKGRDDIEEPRRCKRRKPRREYATRQDAPRSGMPLFVLQEDWMLLLSQVEMLAEVCAVFGD